MKRYDKYKTTIPIPTGLHDIIISYNIDNNTPGDNCTFWIYFTH